MNPHEDDRIEQRMSRFLSAAGREETPPDEAFLARLREQSAEAFIAAPAEAPARSRRYRIMHSRTVKWLIPSAIAAAILAVVLPVGRLALMSPKPAYALAQTIEASKGVRFLQYRFTEFGDDATPEIEEVVWMEFDANGLLTRERTGMEPGKNVTVTLWEAGVLKRWTPATREFQIMYQPLRAEFTQESLMERYDPKLAVETINNLVTSGKMSIEISEPRGGDIELTLRRIAPKQEMPRWWTPDKLVVLVDPSTKLMKQRDSYVTRDGRELLKQRYQYLAYNDACDRSMFVLTPPEGANVDDQTVGKGMPQGNLTDAQAAVAVVRQYIEAMIVEDYETAARLANGTTAKWLRDGRKKDGKVVRLVWTGEAVPRYGTASRALEVPYTYEIEKNGTRELWGPKSEHPERGGPLKHRAALVCPVPGHPDRWCLLGPI